MVALSTYLKSHGFDPQVYPHTRSSGIWSKLSTLYNLSVIDERENSFDFGEEDHYEEKYHEFALPEDDFGGDMWEKGRLPEGEVDEDFQRQPSMEPELPTRKRKRGDTLSMGKTRASTVEDTDDAGTSPAPSSVARGRSGRTTRQGRGRPAKITRTTRGSSERGASKDTAIETDEPADEPAEPEEEEEEEEEDGTPSPKGPRSGTRKGRPGPKGKAQTHTRKSSRLK